ncbi:hypothetical protein KAR48_20160 [bacterium]|nr:hypothetical protein [bacterium]
MALFFRIEWAKIEFFGKLLKEQEHCLRKRAKKRKKNTRTEITKDTEPPCPGQEDLEFFGELLGKQELLPAKKSNYIDREDRSGL